MKVGTKVSPSWEELSSEHVASHKLDWRRILCSTYQTVHFPVQLQGKMKVAIGTLDFRADLLHVKKSTAISRDATALLNKEILSDNALNNTFYQYAKQWWDDYLSESKSRIVQNEPSSNDMSKRLVKMFAEDEQGQFKMVCTFITPMKGPLSISTPSEASRFVGIIPFERINAIGGGREEIWKTIPTFLALGKGDCEEHAVSICIVDALLPML